MPQTAVWGRVAELQSRSLGHSGLPLRLSDVSLCSCHIWALPQTTHCPITPLFNCNHITSTSHLRSSERASTTAEVTKSHCRLDSVVDFTLMTVVLPRSSCGYEHSELSRFNISSKLHCGVFTSLHEFLRPLTERDPWPTLTEETCASRRSISEVAEHAAALCQVSFLHRPTQCG